MDKLLELVARCKYGVFVSVNGHRSYYKNAEQILDEYGCNKYPLKIDQDVRNKMIETDTIVRIRFYTDTSPQTHEIWHYDLDTALDEALVIEAKCYTDNKSKFLVNDKGELL